MAQQYYRKPVALGGGGNTFTGTVAWNIPPALDTTGNGIYTRTASAAQSVTIQGVGNETGNDGTTQVKVTMVVGPNSITSTTINN